MLSFSITKHEQQIIEDIEEVGYGEIYGIHPLDEVEIPDIPITKHEAFKELISELRKNNRFDRIIIHGSLPAYGVFQTVTEGGRSCVKKFKFS